MNTINKALLAYVLLGNIHADTNNTTATQPASTTVAHEAEHPTQEKKSEIADKAKPTAAMTKKPVDSTPKAAAETKDSNAQPKLAAKTDPVEEDATYANDVADSSPDEDTPEKAAWEKTLTHLSREQLIDWLYKCTMACES